MSESENDFLRFVSEDNEQKDKSRNKRPWKIIVADDDEEVHAVTTLALSGFEYKGRHLELLSSYSAEETKSLILNNPDTAVILLDVVMENHDSGLQLVKFIRETADNGIVRIILRTGQPGYAPEMEVIYNYDINDYKEKTELTSSKLVTTLIASLRNFHDLQRIEENRRALEIIAANSAELHGLERATPYDFLLCKSLSELVESFSPDSQASIINGEFVKGSDQRKIQILRGTGRFEKEQGRHESEDLIPRELLSLLKGNNDQLHFYNDQCIIGFKSPKELEKFIYLEDLPELSQIKKNILQTFSTNISTVYSNIELLEEQKRKEEQIQKSLDEKLVLVKEIHHRVKNNLQIISSLLHMQSAGMDDPKLIQVIRESENRVQSMSLVHEKLYQSDLMATIDFSHYLTSLADRLIHTYNVGSKIHLDIVTEPIMLSINKAIPCGLIVNEILTNSLKYAFPDDSEGIITIQMKEVEEKIVLKLADNGIGLPADFDPSKTKSLGTKLINVLTDQIDGELEIGNEGGTSYKLTFFESEETEL